MSSESKPGPDPPPRDHDRYERESIDRRKTWLEAVDFLCEKFITDLRDKLDHAPAIDPNETRLVELKQWLKTALMTVEGTRDVHVRPQLERISNESDFVDVPIKSGIPMEGVDPESALPPQLEPPPESPPPEPPTPPKKPKGGRQ